MKLLKRLFVVALMGLVITACSKVPAGNVGIRVNLLGSDKGVQIEELGVGRYYVGWNQELFIFPTFTQNKTWTGNERVSFQTKDGMKVSGDIGLTYAIDPTKATSLFEKYRAGVDEITDKYLYMIIRDAFNEKASLVGVDSVYGSGKSKMLREVEDRVREQVAPYGIIIERINYVSDLILPPQVTDSINAKEQAKQTAILRENEIQSSIAEANKLREEARGKADAKIIEARGDAEAMRERAQVLKENPSLITLEFINKWSGDLPKVSGNDQMMLLMESALK